MSTPRYECPNCRALTNSIRCPQCGADTEEREDETSGGYTIFNHAQYPNPCKVCGAKLGHYANCPTQGDKS